MREKAIRRASTKSSERPIIAGISVSNPDRVVYPAIGITKLDVARYYETIGDWIVPHVEGRPLTLVLCPEGMSGQCLFLKHAKVWGPKVIRRIRIQEKKKIGEYMIADSISAVVALAQMGILEIHTWNTTSKHIEKPNRIVIDLDPGENVKWTQVISAARLVRKVLSAVELDSFVKTTGGRGLHVVVPITPRCDWSKCLEFSRSLAYAIARNDPDNFTTNFSKAGRESKILIDFMRNNRTNTSVSAFSTRAKDTAPVSVPITWNDLKSSLNPSSFTIQTVPRRLAKLRTDAWKGYWTTKQRLTDSMIKAVGNL
ncbi:MAG TPA: non-homologous end-joining DNA ligase [Gemmatimonadaceae bacterium]|nr:non-homologous end-joining DNA ligase [Gemmatimonadaceae bacterium]